MKDNSMPAFPSKYDLYRDNQEVELGMSLCDYFAAKAMQGMLSTWFHIDVDGKTTADIICQNAYLIADAMLKAREK